MGGGGWKGALTGAAGGALTGGIGGGAAGGAAATGVKGALTAGLKGALTNPAVLGAAGSAIGAMGNAAAQNRGEADRLNINRDSLAIAETGRHENALQNRARLEIEQRAQADAERKAAFMEGMKSALAMNMKDVSFDRSGFKSPVANISFSGGARPSALGPQGRDVAAAMNNSALQRLMSPQPMQELPAPERVQMSDPSKASFWEKLAGPVGMGLTIAGQAMTPGQPAPVPGVPQMPGVVGPPVAPPGTPAPPILLPDPEFYPTF